MAKKKPNKASDEPAKTDRHKPRKHVAIDPKIHRAMAWLADRNRRPLTWEIEGLLTEAAQAAGLWPPPDGYPDDADQPED